MYGLIAHATNVVAYCPDPNKTSVFIQTTKSEPISKLYKCLKNNSDQGQRNRLVEMEDLLQCVLGCRLCCAVHCGSPRGVCSQRFLD